LNRTCPGTPCVASEKYGRARAPVPRGPEGWALQRIIQGKELMAGSNRFACVRGRQLAIVRAAARATIVTGMFLLAVTGPADATWAGSVAGRATLTASLPAADPAPPAKVKYYIVQRSYDGRPEYLFEIAVKTLHNSNLSMEIFRLNKGRLQPGGGRLENPDVIRPGWILILPPNASGPGVHYGPLPQVRATSTRVTPGTPRASVPGRRSAAAADRRRFSAPQLGLAAAAAALLAILITLGLTLLIRRHKPAKRHQAAQRRKPGRRRRRGSRRRRNSSGTSVDRARADKSGAPAGVPQPDSPASPPPAAGPAPVPSGGVIGAPAHGSARRPFNLFASWSKPAPADSLAPADSPAPATEANPTLADVPPSPGEAARLPLPDWLESDDADVPAVTSTATLLVPATGQVPAAGASGGLPLHHLGPELAAEPKADAEPLIAVRTSAHPPAPDRPGQEVTPEEPADPGEVHEVVLGWDRIRIALASGPSPDLANRGRPGGQPYPRHLAWAPLPYDTPDGGVAFACLGSGNDGCVFLDLGQAPGVITIGGDSQAVSRLAESIAHQLSSAVDEGGCMVVLVGDAVPRPHPPGATWLADLDRVGSVLSEASDATVIMFCKLSNADETKVLSDRLSAARCRVIPVLLNGPLEAPWSLTATVEGSDMDGTPPG
jgi:hypothetical protein